MGIGYSPQFRLPDRHDEGSNFTLLVLLLVFRWVSR